MFIKRTVSILIFCFLPLCTLFAEGEAIVCHDIQTCNPQGEECLTKRICHKHTEEWFDTALDSITGTRQSALEERLQKEAVVMRSLHGITFDEPTYVLPFYYTRHPDQEVGPTPDNQKIMSPEFKMQMSFKFLVWHNMFHSHYSLGGSYTQRNFWQVYAKSQYFRETNYMPTVFIENHFQPNWLIRTGIVHQSNGRGGTYERSWNRIYANLTFSGQNWLISLKPWFLIFQSASSDLHNPDVAHYMGYERIVLAYRLHSQELSVMVRNSVESGFKRMGTEVDYAFPIHGMLTGYLQFFHGYGQSLIEYNHKTNAAGIGLSLSNWI